MIVVFAVVRALKRKSRGSIFGKSLPLLGHDLPSMAECAHESSLALETLTQAGSMLGQRRRRWTNIEPTLGQYLVFADIAC